MHHWCCIPHSLTSPALPPPSPLSPQEWAQEGFTSLWLPPPSESQRAYLARLGATSEQIAVLRTKAEAADLIQRFLSGI